MCKCRVKSRRSIRSMRESTFPPGGNVKLLTHVSRVLITPLALVALMYALSGGAFALDSPADTRARETEGRMTDDERFSMLISLMGTNSVNPVRDRGGDKTETRLCREARRGSSGGEGCTLYPDGNQGPLSGQDGDSSTNPTYLLIAGALFLIGMGRATLK